MKIALIFGIFQGAIYGLMAVGLVLVYKGMRVFNFAQGEFGTVAAYITWTLYTKAEDPKVQEAIFKGEGGWYPYWAAALIGLVCVVILGLIVERLVMRPLLDASRTTLLVATVGVALFLISIQIIWAEAKPRTMAPMIAEDPKNPFLLWGVGVTKQQLLMMAVLGALGVVMFMFFRTDRGMAVLALSQDQTATRVVGISIPGMSRFIWASAALLGGIAGILYAPVYGITPAFMTVASGTSVLIPAFAGAVIGGMDSIAGAFIGGILVGIVYSVGQYQLNFEWGIPGGESLSVFAVLLLVLLIRPRGLLGKET